MRDFDRFLSLDGRWSLVAGGRLRIRELRNLKGRTVGMARFANSATIFRVCATVCV